MSDKTQVDEVQALSLLYLQKMDTSQLSPSEFLDKYQEVYKEIKERRRYNYEVSKSQM